MFIFRPYHHETATTVATIEDMDRLRVVLNKKPESDAARELAPFILAVVISIGAVAPPLANALEPLAFPALFLLLVFSLSLLDDRPERILGKIDMLSVKIVIWQLFAVPAVVLLLSFATAMPSELRMILLISATASSVFASPAIVHILGLDTFLATRSMVLSTLLMPVSLLLFGVIAGALPLELAISEYLFRVGIFLIVPLVLSSVWRRFAESLAPKKRASVSVWSYWGSIAALSVFGIGVLVPIHEAWGHDFTRVVVYTGVAILFGFVVFGMSVTLFVRSGFKRSNTAGMLGAARNVGLSFAILGPTIGAEVALYVAVCQFPIFLMPVILRLVGGLTLVPKDSNAA